MSKERTERKEREREREGKEREKERKKVAAGVEKKKGEEKCYMVEWVSQ